MQMYNYVILKIWENYTDPINYFLKIFLVNTQSISAVICGQIVNYASDPCRHMYMEYGKNIHTIIHCDYFNFNIELHKKHNLHVTIYKLYVIQVDIND